MTGANHAALSRSLSIAARPARLEIAVNGEQAAVPQDRDAGQIERAHVIEWTDHERPCVAFSPSTSVWSADFQYMFS